MLEIRSPLKAADRIFISCALKQKAPLVTWDAQLLHHAMQYGVSAITPEQYASGVVGNRILPPSNEELLALVTEEHLSDCRDTLQADDPLAIAIDLAAGSIEAVPEHLNQNQRQNVLRIAESLRGAWSTKP